MPWDHDVTEKASHGSAGTLRPTDCHRENRAFSFFNDPPTSFPFDVGSLFGDPAPDDGISRNQLVILVSGHHAALKQIFRNTASGLSYLPVVWHRLCHSPPPRRILEWGPGRSTLFFAEQFPEAMIDGIEHDPRRFAHCRRLEAAFPGGRVRMHHRRLAIGPGRADAYVTWPLYQSSPETKYDLIFIDGRLRADCAAVASLVLAEGGTVLIHDADREVYQPVLGLYPAGEVVYNTAILGGAVN